MSTDVRMRRRLHRLERALAGVVVLAALGAGAAGCDAFAEPSEGLDADGPVFPGSAGSRGFGPVPGAAPVQMPTFPTTSPVVPPPCPMAIPSVGSACSSTQLCMYTTQTTCTVVSLATCTGSSSVWRVTEVPLGTCPVESGEDAGVDDDDDAGLDDPS